MMLRGTICIGSSTCRQLTIPFSLLMTWRWADTHLSPNRLDVRSFTHANRRRFLGRPAFKSISMRPAGEWSYGGHRSPSHCHALDDGRVAPAKLEGNVRNDRGVGGFRHTTAGENRDVVVALLIGDDVVKAGGGDGWGKLPNGSEVEVFRKTPRVGRGRWGRRASR